MTRNKLFAITGLFACGALVLGVLPDVVRGRTPVDRIALSVVASWHAVGPALVLLLAGPRPPAWRDTPVYAAALAAQFAFDYGFNIERVLDQIFPSRKNQRYWEDLGAFHFSIGLF